MQFCGPRTWSVYGSRVVLLLWDYKVPVWPIYQERHCHTNSFCQLGNSCWNWTSASSLLLIERNTVKGRSFNLAVEALEIWQGKWYEFPLFITARKRCLPWLGLNQRSLIGEFAWWHFYAAAFSSRKTSEITHGGATCFNNGQCGVNYNFCMFFPDLQCIQIVLY